MKKVIGVSVEIFVLLFIIMYFFQDALNDKA